MQHQIVLFAQGQGPPPEFFAGFLAVFLGILAVMLLIGLAIGVFYCLTLSKALNQVSERNRLMQPGLVWLLLIPCIGFVWHFFIAIWVPDSLKKEFKSRGMNDGSDYGKLMGLLASGSGIAANVVGVIPFIGGPLGGVIGLAGLVLFIIFWVKIAGYSSELAKKGNKKSRKKLHMMMATTTMTGPAKKSKSRDEDEDDEPPPPPRKRKRPKDDDD